MICRNKSDNYTLINRCVALVVFLLTLTLYSMTAQSSVAYWDCAEYAATSPTLQVPHPPGAPLFSIITRIASMLPIARDIALRMNLVSALASAFAIMFLYLIGVRVISRWEGKPKDFPTAGLVYGSSAIGALALSVSDTFWFNAVESGLFATSIFFISIIVWVGVVWYDEAEKPGKEKLLLLAAYLLGVSSGVHQLCLLSFFPVIVLIFMKNYELNWGNVVKFGGAAVVGFFVIYPGIMKWMVAMLSGTWSFGPLTFDHSSFVKMIPIVALAFSVYGLYRSWRSRKRLASMVFAAGLLVMMGYSTYTLIYLRANSNPPVNEDDPNTLERMVGYLEREQYGKQPALWPRRWNPEPQFQANYAKYSSDLGYFWSYQVEHMYLRYLGFNFIGRAGDIQNAPVALFGSPRGWRGGEPGYPARYFAIPFVLALFGVWYHFKRDWKTALVFMTMFVVMGFALAVYFNMADPQPRERDYFFVGSFWVFALWIGVGAAGIIEMVMNGLQGSKLRNGIVCVTGLSLLAAVPGNMFRENLFTHDRHDNYAPLDISYDILQSCPKNALLFTGGDNDTFPLWYLQESLGVRTDVRVICLSLANTDWYLEQLKNDSPHGAKKVRFAYTDEQIEQIAHMGGVEWKPKTFRLPVPPGVYKEFGFPEVSAADTGYIQYTIEPTIGSGTLQGVRVQDLMINSIVTANQWRRPICFAITVAPRDCIGLVKYFERQGLVYQLTPISDNRPYFDRVNVRVMRKCLFDSVDSCWVHQHYGFLYKDLNKPGIYYDSNTRGMAYTIRDSFVTLATYYQSHNDSAQCVRTLEAMETRLPVETMPADYRTLSLIARLCYLSGATRQFQQYAAIVEKDALEAIEENPTDVSGNYNPYSIILAMYEMGNEYGKEIAILQKLQKLFPDDRGIGIRINQLRVELNGNRNSQAAGDSMR